MRRLGILGGSFDPIHRGHMHMAVSARAGFALDEVWLVPAGHSPNKDEAGMTAAEHRFRMCELAAREDGIRVSRLEIDSGERSYTYRTLERLRADLPSTELFFIMGGDSLDYLERWVRPERICELATILVVPRDSFDTAALDAKILELRALFPCRIKIVPTSLVPLSSTKLRARLFAGTAEPGDFPEGVFSYIREHGLYERECARIP